MSRMERASTHVALQEFCADRLGEELASHFVKLARPGFALTAAAPGKASGRSRFGGQAILEPGTPWPTCDDLPLSLIAVLDTDALPHQWLRDLLPDNSGLLNFFCLDTNNCAFDVLEYCDGRVWARMETGKVIAARSACATPADPPAGASIFSSVAWAASPGFAFPNLTTDLDLPADLGPEAKRKRDMLRSGLYLENEFPDWEERPGALDSPDIAFGYPKLLNNLMLPNGQESRQYRHLLQLSGTYEWGAGGDGGKMHWSIPTTALRDGDFSYAIPSPDYS